MSEKTSMFELLNERMEKEDIVKLVCNYDNKFNELEEENARLNNIIKEQGLEDKPNYYVNGLEGCLKEYQEEVKRLNNIINEALGIANERYNYYFNKKDKELLEDWKDIFDVLTKRDNQELKGVDKE